ncbi:MAG TPA: Holliday junction branch migration protein RuvA [Candidatus Saccharimonadales bacterium]|nr:Holliday junction branch migration protein RuvA [Candidatus Saccharimonadales bacterium]
MIARIRGKLVEKTFDSAIVEAGGVGYEVLALARDLANQKIGDEVTFITHQYIREDQQTLYGFGQAEDRQFFSKLLTISGIGPKVALAVLQAATPTKLNQAIATGNPDILRGVSGIGNKTAQRITLELKGKINAPAAQAQDETYQALVGLGYSSSQSAEAAAKVPTEVVDPAERVKAALKGLAK